MEHALGADFRGVRLHTDEPADWLNRVLGARAFTTGRDIFFRRGEDATGAGSARALLAHELAHVVQQDPSVGGRPDGAHLPETAGGPVPAIQRRPGGDGDQPVAPAPTGLPTTPSIAALATRGRAGFGDHASVYLAQDDGGRLKYTRIDLYYAYETTSHLHKPEEGRDPKLEELGWSEQVGYKMFGKERSTGQPLGIRIKIQPAGGWPNLQESHTWPISADAADRALAATQAFQRNAAAGKYYFSPTGIGVGGYNCSKMAAEIVRAAGVDASSGLLIHTPGELVTGSKLPQEQLKDPNPTKHWLSF